MNKTPTNIKSNQLSILGFVDSLNYDTGKSRAPRSKTREILQQHSRYSSSGSLTRKRKLSSIQAQDKSSKKIIMEPATSQEVGEHTTPPSSPKQPPISPQDKDQIDPFTKALNEMEARITLNMKNMLDPLKLDISSLVQSQKEWEQHKSDVNELKFEKTRLNNRIQEVEECNNILEDRVRKLEDKLMESNLILHGVKESKWELDSTRNELVIQAISSTVIADNDQKKMEITRKILITSTACLGRYNSMQSRPIRVSFASKQDAKLLLERKKKLKQGIYINREYSDEDEKERKLLHPILKATRKYMHYRGKCKMEGTKLIIKGKTYTKNNLNNLPEDISAASISSKRSDHAMGFFGELNPLSNFHPCTFMYNSITYHSSEQLIQYQKAKLFRDNEAANKILMAKTALDCKLISKDIKNYDHECWKTEAKARCEEGIKAKYMQNIEIRSYLLNTGTLKIVESCNDKFWGTGVPLYEENCLNPSNWTSQGLLGEILENIRTNIRDIMGINGQMDTTPPPSSDET